MWNTCLLLILRVKLFGIGAEDQSTEILDSGSCEHADNSVLFSESGSFAEADACGQQEENNMPAPVFGRCSVVTCHLDTDNDGGRLTLDVNGVPIADLEVDLLLCGSFGLTALHRCVMYSRCWVPERYVFHSSLFMANCSRHCKLLD